MVWGASHCRRSCLITIALLSAAASAFADFSAYFVGNSLTGDLMSGFRYPATLYQNSLGNTYDWGVHYRGSTSLAFMYDNPYDTTGTTSVTGVDTDYSWHTNNPSDPNYNGSFVPWSASLPDQHWDAVILQPWQDSTHVTMAQDVNAINGMIATTQSRADNESTHFYIYAAWPTVDAENSPLGDAFLAPTPNDPNQLDTQTRDYYRNLLAAVRETNPDVDMIPAGEVFLALDIKMRNGEIPGFTSIRDIHRDSIHLNSFGSDIVAYTAYATIFGLSPVGLAAPVFDLSDAYNEPYFPISPSPEALLIIQQTVWDVVTEQRLYTSVVPESNFGLIPLGLMAIIAAKIRRRLGNQAEARA